MHSIEHLGIRKARLACKLGRLMCLAVFATMAFSMPADARGYTGQITLTQKNVSLVKIFREIRLQTGYLFLYNDKLIEKARPVSIVVKNASLEEVLEHCFNGQQLSYTIMEKTIEVTPKGELKTEKLLIVSTPPIPVQGKVTGNNNEPLAGVSIKLKGGTTGTYTDSEGRFSLTNADNNGILIFSYVGYISREIPVKNQSTINVILEAAPSTLNEVVMIGYGTQRRSELTGAISSVNSKDIAAVTSGGIQEALQGRVAGVNITPTSGQPGGALDMNIRGVATFGNGNPLFVIDGVPALSEGTDRNFNPLAAINPDNIESIQILKDASAAAIYGARAANGVVLVTTIRGKAGATITQAKVSRGVSDVTHTLPMMSTGQYIPYATEAYVNSGRAIPVSFVEPNLSKNLKQNTDWQKEGFRSGIMQNYWLGVSGGSESATYSFTGGYMKEEGTLPMSSFSRYSTSINSDFKVGNRIKIGQTAALSRDIWTGTFNQASSLMRQLNQQSPTVPVYNPAADGGFDGPRLQYSPVGRANSIADLTLFENRRTENKLIGNVYADIEILPGLTNRFSVGGEITLGRTFQFIPTYDEGDRVNTLATLTEGRFDENVYLVENVTTYKKVFNKIHRLTALLGFTQQQDWASGTTIQVRNFQSNDLRTVAAGFEQRSIAGEETGWALRSQYGRVNYAFKNTVNLMGVVRRDGSSRFGTNNRFGVFPSVSGSWILSNESFMQKVPALANLTLRASYGQVGSQDISNFAQYATIQSNVNYIFGTGQALTPGSSFLNSGNANLKWEVTTQTNIGVDLGFLDRRLSVVMDYYIKKTDGILVQLPIVTTSGIRRNNGPFVNAGSLQNKGFEFTATYQSPLGKDFSYNVSANISTNQNKVLSLNSGQPIFAQLNSGKQSAITVTKEGSEIGAFYGYVMEGIFKDKTDLTAHATQAGSDAGDVKFKDLDGNGVINALDQTVIGSPSPDFAYGVNVNLKYKSFDLVLFVMGKQGQDLYNLVWADLNEGEGDNNATTEQVRRWTPQNQNTDIPRAVTGNPGQNTRPSSRFIEKGSYLRIQNVQLGYNLPNKLTRSLSLSSLRLYVSAQNLYTFTNYHGYNPEIGKLNEGSRSSLTKGIDFAMYPLPRTIEGGIRISL